MTYLSNLRRVAVGLALAACIAIVNSMTGGTAWAQVGNAYYFVDEAKLPFDALPGASAMWGVHKGAGYRIEVPHDWNGDLVMYAHGFRGEDAELTVSNPRIREYLISQGFAWAASSFSRNRYDIKAGVQDTMALAKLFNGLVDKPGRVFITGHSMGGHVTGVAIEQYPRAFAGAVPMCGVMSDVEEFDFIADFNMVAQAVTGFPAQFPPDPNYPFTVAPFLIGALGAPYPFVLTPEGEKLKAVTENLSGGERPGFDFAFVFWNAFGTLGTPPLPFLLQFGGDDGSVFGISPGNVYDNIDTVYQLDSDPALSPEEEILNANVLRVASDPQGRHPNGLAGIPVISGDIQIPVVSIHTIGDLFVPFSHEQTYARRVAAHGKADMLVTRAIRDVGHCFFAIPEEAAAFQALLDWVDTGVKPAGDDVLDAANVAAADFGCNFTLFDRPIPGLSACTP